ncbi:MAG: 8-oxo-dGTP diphosphatase [Candidatus Woesearchaeota archaeon]
MRHVTLCLLVEDEKIILGMKKRGFGAGKYNGFGGKQEGDETLLQTAVRELGQETGVDTEEQYLKEVAELTFRFPDKPDWNQIVHVYFVTQYNSEPKETEEMRPEWFSRDAIPYEKMWEADRHWMPQVLEGRYVKGSFVYSAEQTLLDTAIHCSPLNK